MTIAGQNEDAPLMIKNDDPNDQGSQSADIELSPSSSPQNASPVHIQFSPSDRAVGLNKKKKDS